MLETIVAISIVVTGIASLIWIADREKPLIQEARRWFREWRKG